MDKHFNWMGYSWRITPFWGNYHKEKYNVWYGTESVFIDNDMLVLDCVYQPKEFQDNVCRNYNVGYVVCEEEFKYGVFEWTAKLPKGKNLWPALWLGCRKEWPPEIDCMEAWSNTCMNSYSKRLFWLNIHPTIHWKENEEHVSEAKFNILRWNVNQYGWNRYKVIWLPESISIYYNDKLVKKFDNHKMLAHFNQKDIKMFPIMTFDISEKHKPFDLKKYKDYKTKGCPFLVKDFRYEKI